MTINNKIKKRRHYGLKIVSLFSGAGGMDLGLIQAGHKIIWAIDNDIDCVNTYKINIGNHIIHKKIEDVSSDEIPEADIVIGGFPCQGFSIANKFRSEDDDRNVLYLEMLRVIRDKMPMWFIAENVRGILNLERGEVFRRIISDFEDAGYCVKYDVVNMADYGIPQSRVRVIIIGTRKDNLKMEVNFPPRTNSKDGNKLPKWISINEALKSLNKLPLKLNLEGSKYKVNFRNFSGHRQTDGDKPCPTITARGNGCGGVNAVPHPNGIRRLNVRESAWMQSFPADYEFTGSINSMYRQVGNAVPVKYGYDLGRMFL